MSNRFVAYSSNTPNYSPTTGPEVNNSTQKASAIGSILAELEAAEEYAQPLTAGIVVVAAGAGAGAKVILPPLASATDGATYEQLNLAVEDVVVDTSGADTINNGAVASVTLSTGESSKFRAVKTTGLTTWARVIGA